MIQMSFERNLKDLPPLVFEESKIRDVIRVYNNSDYRVYKRVKIKGEDKYKRVYYYNIASAFDIETSSFYDCGEKRAIMYVWQFGIDGIVIIGRTWDEFRLMMNILYEELSLSSDHRLIIYVHNLGFEFQHFRKEMEPWKWEKVFALKERTPIYALLENGIEFRCSYLLTGRKLELLGESLTTYKVKKLVNSLEYGLKRFPWTPLTQEELDYCANDARVVMAAVQEKIDTEGSIIKIPLTKTGYVRRFCREHTIRNREEPKESQKYKDLMNMLTLTLDEYKMCRQAFQGGFTHAYYRKEGKTLTNVRSLDFTSSYPAVMVAEKYPISKGTWVKVKDREEFEKLCKDKCVIAEMEFCDITQRVDWDSPISESKCLVLEGGIINNGRVFGAKRLVIIATNIDYEIYQKFYTAREVSIGKCLVYDRAYLPKLFMDAILELYVGKTEYKDVESKIIEYALMKEMLNSGYGMIVTDIVRGEITYIDDWGNAYDNKDIEEINKLELKQIEDYNNSVQRFLFYPWGVFVTAYARRNLFEGILECGSDYIYSDTDSVKVENYSKHAPWFESNNKDIINRIENAVNFRGIDVYKTRPKSKDGEIKYLGVWSDEGEYTRFKTLGAKRYMTEKNKKGENIIDITVAGVNKEFAVPYIKYKYPEKEFEHFDTKLLIPAEYEYKGKKISGTGKLTHTYIDKDMSGIASDYLGVEGRYEGKSGIHLEGSDFCMKISESYINFLLGIRTETT